MKKSVSVFSVTRRVCGQRVVIALTDEEAIAITKKVLGMKFNDTVTEPETKPEWKPVRAYATGVVAQHREETIKMYEQGMSCNKIAEHWGVTPPTVRRFLLKNGVKMRSVAEATRVYWNKPSVA